METPPENLPIDQTSDLKDLAKPTDKSQQINPDVKPSRKLSTREQEILDFIEENGQPVSDALTELVQKNRFVLVGESHLEESEPIRRDLASSLSQLQQAGLTHVALEANSVNQPMINSLDYTDPQIKDVLKQKHAAGVGWGEGNFDVLIMAKRLGLKVILIDYDDGRPDSDRDNARWQNTRDSQMIKTLNNQIDETSKVLIFIGSAHVHQREVEGYSDGKVKRIGARLVEQYGSATVKSVRHVGINQPFDDLPSFMSKTPSPKDVSCGKEEAVIAPDVDPIKGDSRVSAADYVVAVV